MNGFLLPGLARAGGTWTPLTTAPLTGVNSTTLLSDGSVLTYDGLGNCNKLAPDIHGSYINGTWTTLAAMNDGRLFFASALLTNGQVFVAGGEYGAGHDHAELYDPLNNLWTRIPDPVPGVGFSDAMSKMLPSGNVLVAPVSEFGGCLIYNVGANNWQTAGTAANQNETCWVRLANDNIITIDTGTQNAEHYVPSLNQWYPDNGLPVPLYGFGAELGPGFLLPNGSVFCIGATTNTAIYTPGAALTDPGTWTVSSTMPNNLGAVDAPAAMMVNGKILCALGPVGGFNGPTSFYEYNYTNDTFTLVTAPGGGTNYGSSAPFGLSMLDLPDGSVLLIGGQNSSSLFIYTPDGTPLAAGQPVINGISQNFNGSYHLSGLGLSGISGGAAYGDDEQMDSNYPLVRLTNSASHNVYYARTYNWSSSAVQTGSQVLTTEFSLPLNLPAGTYSLVVVANGNPSAPTNFVYSPPAAPTGLTGTAGNAQAILSWNAVSGATAYNLKRLTTTSPPYYATVTTVTGTSCTNIGLLNQISYFYVVTAVSTGGESANSAAIFLTPSGAPPIPAGVTAIADTFARIDLNWTASYGATNYNVRRSTNHNGAYGLIATTPNPFYTDAGLINGTTYYYVVSAVSSEGESGNSTEASATAQAVANLGFEIPVIGSGNYQYAPTAGFWTFSGSSGNGAGLIANGSGFGNPNAPQGVQAAFVQSNGVVSQVLSGFSPGTTYAVIYSAAQRSGSSQHGGESWNVMIDSTVIQTNSPGSTAYVDYTATFIATAATHTLSFVGTDLVGGDNTVFLDNVRVTLLPPVVPNFSFEAPSIGNGNFQYNPTGGSWTFAGASPSGSGIIANGSGFSNPNALDGVQAAFVQELGSIKQTISGFKPGTNYTITYSAAQRPAGNQHGGESWSVKIDNTVIQTNAPGGTSYTDYTASFIATATSHLITFAGTDLATGDNTVFLDAVRITSPLQPAAPSVTLVAPSNGIVLTVPATISLSANVVSNGNLISNVQFYENGTNLIGQASSPPYSASWSNPSSGNYSVFARVNYNSGSVMDSAASSITIVNSSVNFGFESPVIGTGNYQYNPANGGWTFSGSAGNGSGLIANGSGFSNPNAPQGIQAAFVQGYASIAQTLTGFNPGVTYTVFFSAAQRGGAAQHGGESWNVTIDGRVIASYSPGGTSFATYTATFTAWAPIHTLSFVGTDLIGGDNTVFLDNVSLTPPIPPVAPIIQLTSPVNNSGFLAPATVTLTASVNSNGNQINNVQFYFNNTNLIAQLTNTPYSYSWATPGVGNYAVFGRVNYNNSSLVNSTAANISVTNPPLPAPWTNGDVGSVGLTGSATYASGVFTVMGSGTNIGGTADAFQFMYQPINGNCDIRARVVSVQNTAAGAKAGVVIRETLAAGSRSALTDLTPSNGLEFIRRSSTGGNSSTTTVAGLSAPNWVRLVRNKNTFTSYYSTDGTTWTKVGSSQTITMATNVYAGLAVCSQNNAMLCTATFDNVTLPAAPSGIYLPPLLSVASPSGGAFTLQFQGVSDLNYTVQTSTNLTDWTAIYTNALTDADGGLFIFNDTIGTEPALYYRVVQ